MCILLVSQLRACGGGGRFGDTLSTDRMDEFGSERPAMGEGEGWSDGAHVTTMKRYMYIHTHMYIVHTQQSHQNTNRVHMSYPLLDIGISFNPGESFSLSLATFQGRTRGTVS